MTTNEQHMVVWHSEELLSFHSNPSRRNQLPSVQLEVYYVM